MWVACNLEEISEKVKNSYTKTRKRTSYTPTVLINTIERQSIKAGQESNEGDDESTSDIELNV